MFIRPLNGNVEQVHGNHSVTTCLLCPLQPQEGEFLFGHVTKTVV